MRHGSFGRGYSRGWWRIRGPGLLGALVFAGVCAGAGHATEPIVQQYEVYDARYCGLTPEPFLCARCLEKGEQFARLLEFEADGRPVRRYGCVPYQRPYLR